MPSESHTPETHRYVGMWRPPQDPVIDNLKGANVTLCPVCGYQTTRWSCWNRGHFDVPQYEPKAKAIQGLTPAQISLDRMCIAWLDWLAGRIPCVTRDEVFNNVCDEEGRKHAQ